MIITIPGDPVAQGRPRFARVGESVRTIDPKKSRSWKAVAQVHMMEQRAEMIPAKTPIHLRVTAYFRCPTSEYRKREPRPRRWHTKRPDLDNVVKAVKDAGSGVLWHDDSQVVMITAFKIIAAQDEPPRVVIKVEEMAKGAA